MKLAIGDILRGTEVVSANPAKVLAEAGIGANLIDLISHGVWA